MNEDLNCLGVLMTCVKRIPAHESYLKFISKHLKSKKFRYLSKQLDLLTQLRLVVYMRVQLFHLPNARFIKEDYIKVVRSMIRTTSK